MIFTLWVEDVATTHKTFTESELQDHKITSKQLDVFIMYLPDS